MAGPALVLAITPTNTYAPAPSVAPMPSSVRSNVVSVRTSDDGEVSSTLRRSISCVREGAMAPRSKGRTQEHWRRAAQMHWS